MHPRLQQFACVVGAGAALVVAACSADKTTSPSGDVTDVFTTGSVFSPTSATVGVGGTVRFHIALAANGEGHDVTFTTPGAPENIPVTTSDTVIVISRVFPVRGTFAYDCRVHPGMAGEIVVH